MNILNILRRSTSNGFDLFYKYEDILLKTYMEISETGNLNLLVKYPKTTVNQEALTVRWEQIVSKNSEQVNGGYSLFFSNYKAYATLMSRFIQVKAAIQMASVKHPIQKDDPVILLLQEKGYKIDTTSDET